jgi:hypothetical protein
MRRRGVAQIVRRHATAGAAWLVVVATAGPAGMGGQKAENKPARPAVVLDDAFEYALLDFGVGAVPEPLLMLRRQSKRFLWVKVQLTSRAKDQLARPVYWSSFNRYSGFPPTDNFGNTHPAETRTLRAPKASSGRHQPGESSIELILIPADELLDTIKELHIGFADAGRFISRYHGFVLHQPLARVRDFEPERPDPDLADVPATLRRSLLPPDRRK